MQHSSEHGHGGCQPSKRKEVNMKATRQRQGTASSTTAAYQKPSLKLARVPALDDILKARSGCGMCKHTYTS